MKNKSICSDQSLISQPATEKFFLSSHHSLLYQQLIKGFHEGKILLILTGESGLGKTFLMGRITHKLGMDTRVIKGQRNYTKFRKFSDSISKHSGIDLSNEAKLTEQIAWLTRCFPNQHTIVQIDQAQEIKLDTLRTIINWVQLFGSEHNHSPYIHIVLTGLPSLDDLLELLGLHKLEKKTICQCKLGPLSDDEVLDYINFYLNQSDEGTKLFEQDALKRIVFYSRGSPGLINKLCDLGLFTASMNENPTVTATVIDEVAKYFQLSRIKSIPPVIQTSDQDTLLPNTNNQVKTFSSTQTQYSHDTLLNQLLFDNPQLSIMNEKDSENDLISTKQWNEKVNTHTMKQDRLSTASNTKTNRKSFTAGLAFGVLFGLGGLFALNQGWMDNQNKDQSQLQPENEPGKSDQHLQHIQIVKSPASSNSAVQDNSLNSLQDPLPDTATQPVKQTVHDAKQIRDSSPYHLQIINKQINKQVVVEPEKQDN